MSEEQDNLIVLTDEQGNEVEFEHIDSLEYEGKHYALLLPTGQEGEEQDAVVLAIENIDGEDVLVLPEDESVLDTVFELFKQNLDEEFDFEE